jgi:DNA modification methylase
VTAVVLRADARRLPLADNTVDLVVTSPPYFALRSYTDNGVHYAGQVGSEPTPAEFVDALIECTREMIRVLKPSGSIWVNLGDKYAQDTERSRNGMSGALKGPNPLPEPVYSGRRDNGVPRKSLMGLPWRYALRCIDELGLILRAEVIWSKPNGLPESVTDRVRRSHEQWFHFVVQPRYYSAVDRIREPYDDKTADRYALGYNVSKRVAAGATSAAFGRSIANGDTGPSSTNPLGKLPGSVWTIPTQPLKVPAELGVDHFAAFPMEFPRRIITGWSAEGICTACGEGRWPVTSRCLTRNRKGRAAQTGEHTPIDGGYGRETLGWERVVAIDGEVCACPDVTAPTAPAVVLDPFGGTGTVALVASALGRIGVSVDLSADYCRLARWRTTDRGQVAAAMEVDKPAVQVAAQLDLFGEVVA